DYPTIQLAVDAAQPDDLIQISKGIYAPFVIDTKTAITLRGKGKPVIDGGGGAGAIATVDSSVGIVLDGLVIRNSGDRGIVVMDSDDVVVRRSMITAIDVDAVRAWASSNVLVEKCVITNALSGVDFSAEGASPASTTSVVQKNRFEGVDQPVDLDGPGHRVLKNRFEDASDTAVSCDDTATDATIAKNKMKNVGSAIYLLGSGHVVERNQVKGTFDEGIIVEAANCRVEKNGISGVTDDAIDLEGDDNQVLSNTIRNSGDNGIEISPASGDPYVVTGNVVQKNKISRSGGNGIFVDTSGNTFFDNKASHSDGFDLLDQAGSGANMYDGNKFGTGSIP
ncbi:MAG: right-handed parallel beta-helix repeat-containing protein, partial [Phycisphaerales bacterium]|nr:right-handed parallel beta-helix repeat-containing protein [Phycisphaerales bacterium]